MDGILIGHWLLKLDTWAWVADPGTWLIIFQVAIGLGMVIFVHELGHFAVAKLCGVRCDKFYLGFDIAGYKLCKFRIGETEYGIGILPLGGYVKMLGQEDNPARLKEELERAKAARESGEPVEKSSDGEPIDIAAAEAALYDPRSYLAQSVPKRMAIISAGVVMNLIFALVTATAAYLMGVEQLVCEVGNLQPGSPAWQANLEVGDRILSIDGVPTLAFRDLKAMVSLSKAGRGVPMVVRRRGQLEETELLLHPDRSGMMALIGMSPSFSTTLESRDKKRRPVDAGTPAAEANPPLENGDRIVAVNDAAVDDYADLRRQLALHPDETLRVTIERTEKQEPAAPQDAPGEAVARTRRFTIDVAPRPMRRFGLVMTMGPITAVQEGSPAAKADLRAGDRIVSIDQEPPGDPMTLPDRLRRRAGQSVTLSILRDGAEMPVEVKLRTPETYNTAISGNSPVDVAALGVACEVTNRVNEVLPESPAAKAGIKPGDLLVRGTILPQGRKALLAMGADPSVYAEQEVSLGEKKLQWPVLFDLYQLYPPETRLELELLRGEDKITVTLESMPSTDWFNPERGFQLKGLVFIQKAESLGEALSWGTKETWESATRVLILLERLRTGEVSPKSLGGPVMIARVAGAMASEGMAKFLIFLTLLGANLAVLNFLPIPVLDGGHMVFLAWEGLRGKPADERVQIALSYVGLLLILALMVWVFALDFAVIPRE